MRVARSFVISVFLLAAGGAAFSGTADGQGLRTSTGAGAERWQGRLSLSSNTSAPWSSALRYDRWNNQHVDGAVVLADYYFSPQTRTERTTGFRASGGVGFARRGAAWLGRMPLGASTASNMAGPAYEGDTSTTTFPYVGVGYSGIYPKSGWGFTADVGLMGMSASQAYTSSGLRVDGAAAAGQAGTDTSLGSLRMRPVVQVGVSYSF